MLDFAKAVFARELQDMKRLRLRMAVILLVLVQFVIAIIFGILALYFWLDQYMENWQAAGFAAVLALLLGGILALVARAMKRSSRHATRAAAFQPASLFDAGGQKKGSQPSLTTVAAALAAGIILGRNLPK